ncbi:uncharacterized protein LOC108735733 [Agrilus planipennis]|uniref:Uncharacterized protein LOC108735733 n=1 Tax=Agrilus planipennis TaxID=224129 RepID=A0A7F5RGA3_AGRPL|nr:uncharacterized protein LOC108735733 [Agrilus planipennis]
MCITEPFCVRPKVNSLERAVLTNLNAMSGESPSSFREINESSRRQKTRHSLQPIIHESQIKDTRLTQSQGYGRRQRSKLNPLVLKVPSIPEDEEVNKPSTPSNDQFNTFEKSEQKRKNSETRIANNRQNSSASDNWSQTRRDSHHDTLERPSHQRTRITNSSISSTVNPQVQKEQYWWFSKRPFRKTSILICIIIVLSIIILIESLFIVIY